MSLREHPTQQLSLLALGELGPSESLAAHAHLAQCPECRSLYEELRATLDLLGTLPPSAATFQDLLERRAREETCTALGPALTAYAYEGHDAEVEAHVARCAPCAARLREIQALKNPLDRLPSSLARFEDLRPRLAARFPWRRTLTTAATLLFALAVGLSIRPQPPLALRAPSPVDPARARVGRLLASIESLEEGALRAAASRLDRGSLLENLALGEALGDLRDTARSYAALRLLRNLETPAAEDLLARALGKDPSRDEILLRALVELRSPRAVPALLLRLQDPQRRPSALQALGTLRDPATIDPLAGFLEDPEGAEALARFRQAELIAASERHPRAERFVAVPHEALRARLVERARKDAAFRAAACEAATRSGPSGVEFLARLYGADASSAEALAALRRCPGDALERGLLRSREREDPDPSRLRLAGELGVLALAPRLRRGVLSGKFTAAEALPVLAQLQDRDSTFFVLRLLSDKQRGPAAAAALRRIEPARLLEAALPLLREGRAAAPVVKALADLDRRELGPLFIKALDLPELRIPAIEALARLRFEKAVPALTPLLRSEATASGAEAALKEITGEDLGRDRSRWDRWWRKHSSS